MQESASFIQVILDMALWISAVLLLKPCFKYPYLTNNTSRNISVLLVIVFCTYAFWGGDYFHYFEIYNEARHDFYGYFHLENVYRWIIDNVAFTYTIFRIIVWGGALLLLIATYRRSSPNSDLCLFYFVACYLCMFSYSRTSVSIALILLGLSFLANPKSKSKLWSTILCVAIIGSSVFFHRTAVIGIVAAVAALFLRNAGKKTLIVMIIVMPLIVVAMQYVLDYFMLMDLDEDAYVSARHRDRYMLSTSGRGRAVVGGIGERISAYLTRIPLYLSGVLFIHMLASGKFRLFSKTEKIISAFAFTTVLIALCFLIDLGYNTFTLHYRTLNFAMPANAVFLAAVHRLGFNNKILKFIFWLSVLGQFYNLAYSAYCAL